MLCNAFSFALRCEFVVDRPWRRRSFSKKKGLVRPLGTSKNVFCHPAGNMDQAMGPLGGGIQKGREERRIIKDPEFM